MKYLALITLVFIGITILAQERANYTFNVESKLGTDVEISVAVFFEGKDVFKGNDLIIRKINIAIKDSLKRFDVIEMYSTQRETLHTIINHVYKAKLNELDISIGNVDLLDVKIPLEAKLLNERILEFEQSFIAVEVEINNRKKMLENKLQSDTNLSDSEKSKIKEEIMILGNHSYISRIYEEKLQKLMDNK